MTVAEPVAPLSAWATDLRREVIRALRETMPLRSVLINRGSLDSNADLDKVFSAAVEAGRFNERYPAHRITVADLIEIIPAISAIA